MSTEHRYAEGNRLVLELLGAVEVREGGAHAVVSVYRNNESDPPFVVRGYANTRISAPTGDELCLRSKDELASTPDEAFVIAQKVAARLVSIAAETRRGWGDDRPSARPATKGVAS